MSEELRKAAQQALEELEHPWGVGARGVADAIDVLRAALAQPEQEPVAWVQTENFIDPEGLWDERKTFNCEGDGTPLYTRTPQRKPLTKTEIERIADTVRVDPIHAKTSTWHIRLIRAIEKAHGIGGEG